MKYTTIISALVIAAAVSACGKTEQANLATITVTNWGPQTTAIGTIPNKQPDGTMGIWIQVADTQGLGDAQVLFAGQPAKSTVVADKLITALIAPEQLGEPGSKDVAVKQVTTNKTFPVGLFNLTGR